MLDNKTWRIKCGAAFLAIHGLLKLCREIGMRPETLIEIYRDRMGDK